MRSKLPLRVTRRSLLRGAAASVGTGLLLTPFYGNKSRADSSKKGGTLRVGVGHGSTTDILDPGQYNNGFLWSMNYMVFNTLTEKMPDGSIAPELAESWTSTPDARRWTLKIRKGVQFHDGKPLTADDVAASLNHHRGEDATSSVKAQLSTVTDIKAENANQVTLTLSAPFAELPAILSNHYFAIKQAKDGKFDANSRIGTGGYKLLRFEPGIAATLERQPDYWKADRAHFDAIEIVSALDGSARMAGLVSGDFDVVDQLDLKTVSRLSDNKEIVVKSIEGPRRFTFPMRMDMAPFSDKNVRLALMHAIDRDEIVKKVLHGHGKVGNDNPIPVSDPNYNPNLPQRTYDPDRSKFYLKEAGLSSLKVALSVADAAFSGAVDTAVLYQASAAAAGIEIEVDRVSNDGYWSNVWMKKPWSACYWAAQPTTEAVLATTYASDSPWNDTFWKNARFDMLLKQSRAELDIAKRKQIFFELQSILHDENGTLIPMFGNYVFGMRSNVGYPAVLGSNRDLDDFRFGERWWFES